MKSTLRLLELLRESREFPDYLDATDKSRLDQSRIQQQIRVPGVAGQGSTPTPPLAIQMDDLGGPQGIARLRKSPRPEAELKRLISQAEMEKDYDKAARLNDFASDFQMHKSEIGAGLRQNYNDLNTINNNLRAAPNGPTGQQDYLPPLQRQHPQPVKGEVERLGRTPITSSPSPGRHQPVVVMETLSSLSKTWRITQEANQSWVLVTRCCSAKPKGSRPELMPSREWAEMTSRKPRILFNPQWAVVMARPFLTSCQTPSNRRGMAKWLMPLMSSSQTWNRRQVV